MTEHSIDIDAADARRALAAITHNLDGNGEGLATILREANTEGRRIELVLALLNVFDHLLPELRTPLGIELVKQQLMYAATEEGETK